MVVVPGVRWYRGVVRTLVVHRGMGPGLLVTGPKCQNWEKLTSDFPLLVEGSGEVLSKLWISWILVKTVDFSQNC